MKRRKHHVAKKRHRVFNNVPEAEKYGRFMTPLSASLHLVRKAFTPSQWMRAWKRLMSRQSGTERVV
jgi:hypothetical protein